MSSSALPRTFRSLEASSEKSKKSQIKINKNYFSFRISSRRAKDNFKSGVKSSIGLVEFDILSLRSKLVLQIYFQLHLELPGQSFWLII